MRKALPVLLILSALTATTVNAQTIVSEFLWNSGSATHADVGSNATLGPGSTAITAAGGVGGTTGVEPNGNNINLQIPGAEFELNGLDISEDFLRKENGASFFTLGGMDFGINTGAIYAKFLLNKSGTDTAVSLANFMTVPTDANFHTYRFVYDNVSGTFFAFLDGTLEYNKKLSTGYPLSWTGATNATIGSGMDGSGAAFPILDNFIAQTPLVVLPVQLLSFDATTADGANQLEWTTADPGHLRDFTIERSANGTDFTAIGALDAQPGNNYHYTDNNPPATSFYRLRMTDADGTSTWSPVRKLSIATDISISCYPNPVVNYASIRLNNTAPETWRLTVATLDGRLIRTGELEAASAGQQFNLDLTTAPKGILLISLQTANHATRTFKILKQ
ncbi:MAG TPA: T9SS type A sorting domain-containing protein [Puia sp.]|nr:T9SS type A sorting domain-containing protein [Puia sp.]